MTIDEAIEELKSENGYYANNGMTDVAEFNTKIIRLLEDYKQIKMLIPIEQSLKAEYNKAIDDFVERLTTYLGIKDATKYGNKNAEQMRNSYGTFMNYEIAESIEDVAEQLKAGGK